MNIFLIVLISVLILISVILFININILFEFAKSHDTTVAKIRIFIFKYRFGKTIDFTKKKRKKNAKEKIKDQKSNSPKELKESFMSKFGRYLKYKDAFLYSRRKVRKKLVIRRLDINVSYGANNAAKTAVSIGAMWSAVYNVIGFITKTMVLEHHEIKINPVYDSEIFTAEAKGIFKTKIAYIIYAFAVVLLKYKSLCKR